jgi:hypothetical protein
LLLLAHVGRRLNLLGRTGIIALRPAVVLALIHFAVLAGIHIAAAA